MTTVSFAGGAGLSAEIMQAMDQMSREQRLDHRNAALHEADVALSEGRAEARSLHEQADDTLRGAIASGVMTAASGSIQLTGAIKLESKISAGAEALKAHNDKVSAFTQLSSQMAHGGEAIKGGFEAAGGHHAAEAKQHAALAQAATRRADAAQSDAQEAQKMSDKARELHQQILGLDHASRMAVLRG